LTTEEAKEAVNILQKMRVAELVFTGGNPLLREDVGEILRYAHQKFPIVSIYDNGSLAARNLDALRHVDRVCVSLNTLNPELQNSMCGVSGAFKDAMHSITLLKDEGIGVVVSIMISNANIEEVPAVVEYFGRRNISLTFSLHSEVTLPDSTIKIGMLNPAFKIQPDSRLLNLLKTLQRLKKKHPIHLDMKTANSLEKLFSKGVRDWKCESLSSFFIMNEGGSVSGCHIMSPVCKIWELPKIWETEKTDSLRRSYNRCEKCSYLCYIAYSNLKKISNLVEYCFDYERYILGRISSS